MNTRIRLFLALVTLGLVVVVAAFQRAPRAPEPPEPSGVIKLEFGLNSKEPREWNGALSASAGEILSTSGWHFLAPDRIDGKSGWSFSTRLFVDPQEKYRGQDRLPDGVAILPNGVYAQIQAPDSATFSVNTNHGNFRFPLRELKAAGRLSFLEGDVAAVYTPPVRYLTRGEASQHDFPSAAVFRDEVFVAWVTFHNEANFVYLAHLKDGKWTTHRASQSWGDYYASAVAADGAGNVHVVWSEYKQDRWHLVSRSLEPSTGRWSPEQYVAPQGRRQMFHRMATDSKATPWITWQEFSNGNFDIFAASHSAQGWSAPIRISESNRNDWHSAIAAGPDGTVYVAWDGYDQGNYDIFLRAIRDGKPGPILKVTQSETYDAHVSIAVDPSNRVWLAWEEAGPNWGKDTGVLGNPGTPLHASRDIRLVCYENGKFRESARPLRQAVPGWLGSMQEYPHLVIGPNGLPYVFFRHYLHRLPRVENELDLQFGPESRTLQPWYDTVRRETRCSSTQSGSSKRMDVMCSSPFPASRRPTNA